MVRQIAQTFFGGIWKMFLAVDYPGVNVSVAGVAISFLLIRLSISLFKYITGFSAGAGDYGRAADGIERLKSKKSHETGLTLRR